MRVSPPPLVFSILLSLAVVLKDVAIVIEIVTDPILAWLREASQWAKQPECQLARLSAWAMNEDDYNSKLHLTRNSPAV